MKYFRHEIFAIYGNQYTISIVRFQSVPAQLGIYLLKVGFIKFTFHYRSFSITTASLHDNHSLPYMKIFTQDFDNSHTVSILA